jgi:hypothetical protein
MFALIKRMFALTKNMGHEKHMILKIKMTILTMCCTYSQEGQFF